MGASLTEGSLREEAPLVRSGWDMWPDFYETLREKKKKLQDGLDHQCVPSLNVLMPLLLYPKDSHTGVGAEVTYSAIHHGKVILRNGGHFTQGTWEWSTCKKIKQSLKTKT